MQEQVTTPGTGWLEWGGVLGAAGGAVLLLLLSAGCAWYWWRTLGGMRPVRRGVLTALRVAVLALVVFLLLQPTLVQPIYEKSTEVVAILFDDSASMRVKDADGVSRAERLRQALEDAAPAFDHALGGRFHVLEYQFGERARPLEHRDSLNFQARETRILDAVTQIAADMDTLSVSAVVVLSDGGQQQVPDEADWARIRDAGVPVYTVGVGEEAWRDLALGEVALSRSFFDDAPARITAQFSASGLSGQRVVVDLVQGGVVQASEERLISSDHAEQQVQLEVVPRLREWLEYTVRLRFKSLIQTGAPREFVQENNAGSVLLDHREKAYRILYFSGRPNWQNKFVRHALAADPELRLSSLIRISGAEKSFEFKGEDTSLGNPLFDGFEDESTLPRYDEAVFTRLGLGEGELKEGYPTVAEALYPFHLIIWGDIESDFFAPAHLRLTRDAVAERGASFLMLGGRYNLASGGYSGTVIETMLPVMPGAVAPFDGDAEAQVFASPEGFLTGVWALDAGVEASAGAWGEMPALPDVDAISSARIGASTLAHVQPEGAGGAGGGETPFLIWHRFGQGKTALMATGETWPWHMQTEDGNDAHERLWRQLVRSLVSTVPEPVRLEVQPEVLVQGSEGTLAWTVHDEVFARVEGASLRARVIAPGGEATTLPLVERLDTPGTYEGSLTPAFEGKHLVLLEGNDASGEPVATVEAAVLVEPDTREFDDARFDPGLLEVLARETGGRYVPLAALDEVAANIVPTDRNYETLKREPIWHHPAFYMALVLLFCAEWTLRRRWGKP